ncbi:hypothetical protein H4R24_003391 [Coemansia sp. RSA 988]|nr:hypothetical protein H4R24_003391 [Coemansia sp. RSA 988]
MDNATHSTADAGIVGIATLDGKMEDFGLVDYEPPVSDTQSSVEQPDQAPVNEAETKDSADGLIDYQESDYYEESDPGAEFVDTEEGYSAESRAEETDHSQVANSATIAAASAAAAAFASASLEQATTASVAQNEQYYDADDVMIISDEEDEDIGAVGVSVQDQPLGAQSDTGEGTEDDENYYSISEQQQWQARGIESGAGVPETWVYSEGEWVVYLGPEQRSYTTEFQTGLFSLSLSELMDVLHRDFVLGDNMELALEFPSLGVIIDQLIMQTASDHSEKQQQQQNVSEIDNAKTAPVASKEDNETEEQSVVVDEEDAQESEVVENGHAAAADEQASTEEAANGEAPDEADEADTGELVEEDEDEDEDFVPEDEEKEDHVLDPDAVDEEDEGEIANGELEEGTSGSYVEEEAEASTEVPLEEEDGNKTRVDSQNASPTNKRTKEQQLDIDSTDAVEDEPVTKKAKSDDELETDQHPVVT